MVLVETVVSALLSASFNVLFDRMATRQVVDFFRMRFKSSDGSSDGSFDGSADGSFDGSFDGTDLLESLKTKLLTVNVVLSDAEEKQITNPFVKEWVDELKNVVYQVEDLLDEIATLALAEVQNSKSVNKICKALETRLEGIISKLGKIAERKDVLGLKESFGGKHYQRLPTTSLVDECKVYGRNKDKEKIMDFVLSDRENGTEIPVIAIAGMAGVGKTTLAQLLYNDSRVKESFRRAWAYVSEEFDVFKVTKTIYESVTSRDCNITDLNLIQIRLKEELVGQKFLLVLDDVWNENFISWDFLQNSLKDGAKGSRIIVTTRSHSVASTMGATLTHSLQQLSEIDCRSVFETHAFRSKNSQIHPELKRIGENIVEKCQGLPLAAKIIGSLLHSKVEAHEWDTILNSKIWDLQSHKSNILPSLRLSYYYLPSHLKQCFAYCSIFPKRYVIEKEKLVMLWMADGLLQRPRGEKCMEEVGNRYFDELVAMSLFQKNGDKPGFVMHDLVNELAQFVSGEFCFHSESGELHGISEKTRHFSSARDRFGVVQKFEALTEAKFLRTFLSLGPSSKSSSGSNYVNSSIFEMVLPNLSCLRALCLSDCKIFEFPDIFGYLKLLRFLDFSRTEIKALPESTCLLYNLQTLRLSDCTKLTEMPPKFGRLKNLQILTTFVVSNNTGASLSKKKPNTGASSISELGELLQLRGKLSILKLQNVQDSADAEKAKLKDKKYVKELAFHWDNSGLDQQKETDVLEKLRPHKNIEKISIKGYNGTKLPDWLGNTPKLTSFSVSNCNSLQSMPKHMHAPNLTSFSVSNCSSLQSLPEHMHAPNLISLSVSKCSSLQQMHTLFSTSLGKLEISCCPKLESFPNGGLPPNLKTLLIEKCDRLTVHNDWGLNNMTFLTCLTIKGGCSKLNSFPDEGLLPASLKYIQISEFPVLKTLDLKGLQRLALLKDLQIYSCDSLQCFSEHGTLPSSLSSLSITGGSFLTQWCHKGGKYWPKICDIQIREINGDVI